MVQQCLFINRNKTIQTEGHEKILNLLNQASDSKFVKSKWNNVDNQSNVNYELENRIIYKTNLLKANLSNFNNA